jgi:superfamily II DNA or RNA helicase
MEVHILCWCGRLLRAAAPGTLASLADYPTALKDTGENGISRRVREDLTKAADKPTTR